MPADRSSARPALVAVAHGTSNPSGRQVVRDVVGQARALLPDVRVELAWLEHDAPTPQTVLDAVAGPVVLVPVLLSTGFHVKVDIARFVDGRPRAAAAAQLGPDERITEVVRQRLVAAGGRDASEVVLFASGSTDSEAWDNLGVVANRLQAATGSRVRRRFLTDPTWRAGLAPGSAVANYLLAPGRFNDQLRRFGQDELGSAAVADPIGAHPAVAAVIVDRYEQAAAGIR